MSALSPQPVTDIEETDQGDVFVFRWDPISNTQAVVIYERGIFQGPVEQRIWCSDQPASDEQRAAIVSSFDPVGKRHLTDEARRSVQWGEIHADFRAHTNADQVDPLEYFPAPTPMVVSALLHAKILPVGFRNSRDMQAHALELFAAREYLLAVYRDKSTTPMAHVARSLDVTTTAARKIIDRARSHGYLTRTQGLGGEMTEKAEKVALDFIDAHAKALKGMSK